MDELSRHIATVKKYMDFTFKDISIVAIVRVVNHAVIAKVNVFWYINVDKLPL